MIYVAGLDLGQAQDYSAMVIIEARGTDRAAERVRVEGLPLTRLDIRHIERFPLGTKYRQIAVDVGARLRRVPRPCYLVVDQTGVGNGVIELLAHLSPIGVTITAGAEVQEGNGPQDYRVPKRDLVARLQVGLQNGVFRIAQGLPHAEILTRELLNFRAKISLAGHDTYEAWRESDHDDLVLAAGLASWGANLIFAMWQLQAQQRLAWEAAADSLSGSISPI